MKYLAITAILCLVLAGASFAGNVTMTEVLTGGNLTLTMPENFSLSGVTLGGNSWADASAGTLFTVEDSRGSGAGWNLGVQISQFVTAGTPQRSIATNKTSMGLAQVNIEATYGQAVDETNGPKTLINPAAEVAGTEVKVVTAAANYGMGKYNLGSFGIVTVIDAYVYAGTYTATLTATLNNAP